MVAGFKAALIGLKPTDPLAITESVAPAAGAAEKMEKALVDINGTLQAIHERLGDPNVAESIIQVAAVLVAAALAWWAARDAAKRTVDWQVKRGLDSVSAALLIEIESLGSMLDSSIAAAAQYDSVRVAGLGSPQAFCPVYTSSGQLVGHLGEPVLRSIVGFYSAFLTIRPLSDGVPTGDSKKSDIYKRSDLVHCRSLADAAVLSLKKG